MPRTRRAGRARRTVSRRLGDAGVGGGGDGPGLVFDGAHVWVANVLGNSLDKL